MGIKWLKKFFQNPFRQHPQCIVNLKKDFFELWTPYISSVQQSGNEEEQACSKPKRKRRRTSELNEGELEGLKQHQEIRDFIRTAATSLTSLGRKTGYFVRQKAEASKNIKHKDETINVNETAYKGKENWKKDGEFVCHSISSPSMVLLQDGWHILPPESTYVISDASHLQPLVDYAKTKGLFDVSVIDPPWYNKSAKRTGKYSFMSLWQIKALPIPQLLSHDALVVVWVTNKPKYIKFTREELLPHWGVELLAEWHWVKVTRTGDLVTDLDSPHKKPYETLIIGRFKAKNICNADHNLGESSLSADSKTTDERKFTEHTTAVDEDDTKGLKSIPNQMVICSVPCQIHSRKPPLSDALGDYIKKEGRFLEMFARNLTPRWTSWGNEVLKFQHKDYFEEKNSSPD